ncbi:MAG: sulfatase-like hydrolase/transferase, partial [Planctomycetales bacterium]
NAEQRRGKGMHPRNAGFDAYSLFHSLHTEDKGSRYANPTFLRNGKLHKAVEGEYGEDLSVQFILDFMEEHKAEPMFVYYPMALPHWPMTPTPLSAAWKDPRRRLEAGTEHYPDMVEYMDALVGRLVEGVDQLGLREDTMILFYSDNGTDRRITSRFDGGEARGGKNTTAQSGIRVPLIVNWPGRIAPAVTPDLVDPSDFVPTLAELAGKGLPNGWRTDGVSFAPRLLGKPGKKRDWAFFWYDPRPGWDKNQFSRSIFALDHNYKLFADGRMFDVAGTTLRETPLDLANLSPKQEAARRKLQAAIKQMMQPPLSPSARVEVDAYGVPVAEYVALSDAGALKGWNRARFPEGHVYNGGDWKAKSGEIIARRRAGDKRGGWLVSDGTYGDFELELEVRPDWGCDTGILLRQNDHGAGIQITIDYRDGGNVGFIHGQGSGSYYTRPFSLMGEVNDGQLVKLKANDHYDAERRDGLVHACRGEDFLKAWKINDWNRVRVRCVGEQPDVTIWVNDLKTCEMQSKSFRAKHPLKPEIPAYDAAKVGELLGDNGRIGLQIHPGKNWALPDGAVRYRNIRVRPVSR